MRERSRIDVIQKKVENESILEIVENAELMECFWDEFGTL